MLGRLRLGPPFLRGRRFPEPAHPYRNDFQRDRDRIIHSRAFRRLEGKTQVFSTGLGDHFRNRLTHTIEVSQIARTVALGLGLNEEYTETLALAHDLGHPPFGHAGERVLDEQMRRYGSSFEHNRQALRLVDHLEERYARFDGLNLTFEVREGIIKHSRELGLDAEPELQDLLPGRKPPLEAQLLDLADEIAYNSADMDDAVTAGLLSVEDMVQSIGAAADLAEQVTTQFPGASERVRFWEIQRQLMNRLVGGLIEGTAQAAAAARVETLEDVRALDRRIAQLTPDATTIGREMKALLTRCMYSHPELTVPRGAAIERMNELFAFLIKHPEHISTGYRERLQIDPLHRVVCDYVAGMTEAYFLRVHRELLAHD